MNKNEFIKTDNMKVFYISPILSNYLLRLEKMRSMSSLQMEIRQIDKSTMSGKINTMNRSNTITAEMEGFNLFIYNGKEFKECGVIREMIGDKFGDYSFSRKICREKKKKKKKKKILRNESFNQPKYSTDGIVEHLEFRVV